MSFQLSAPMHNNEQWHTATEPYDRIPTDHYHNVNQDILSCLREIQWNQKL